MWIHRNRSSQSDDRRSAVREPRVARSFPRRGCLHALQQPFVRLRRSIQARQEFAVRLRADRKHGAIQKRVLGRAPGSIEDEIRAVLPGEFSRSINQFPYLWLNAKVE